MPTSTPASGSVTESHGAAVSALRPAARRTRPGLTRLWRSRYTVAGLGILGALIVLALFADQVAPYGPNRMRPTERLQPPSAAHPFGTDDLGRDILSRAVFGARLTLTIGAIVVPLSLLLGVPLGVIAGYYRRVDGPIMRIVDGLMAFPAVLFAITLMAALGPSVANVIIALSLAYAPSAARLARGSTLAVQAMTYVEAARALGVPDRRLIARHVLPNIFAPLLVLASFTFAVSVLTEAILSFLGAGAPPSVPSWGTMVAEGRNFIEAAPWLMFFPGCCIAIVVMGLNLLGDGLRDLLDPRLRGGLPGSGLS
jgi:peptide/nickel transport system permease protein